MKIVILDWKTMTENADLSPDCFKNLGDVQCYDFTPNNLAAERIGDADAVLCNKVLITKEVIESCKNLKYIGLFATGFNNVDIACAAENNITVCNAGEYSTMAVAQQVFAYLTHYCNKISVYDNSVKNNDWINSTSFSYFPFVTQELAGKTISIIGYGSIGKAVAKIADAFGMNILISTRTVPENCPYTVTDIDTAVKNADFLTLHCPLTDKTNKMVNSAFLSKMKKSAVLINTSRGPVVDENDLAEALNNNIISAAYLDVLEYEPMRENTPLRNAKNCVITPHIAWAAAETRKRLLDIVYNNLSGFLNGNIINKVN